MDKNVGTTHDVQESCIPDYVDLDRAPHGMRVLIAFEGILVFLAYANSAFLSEIPYKNPKGPWFDMYFQIDVVLCYLHCKPSQTMVLLGP